VDNSELAPSDIGRNTDKFPPGQVIENKGGGFLLPVITFTFKGLEMRLFLPPQKSGATVSLSGNEVHK
jgi:hypothetical protein